MIYLSPLYLLFKDNPKKNKRQVAFFDRKVHPTLNRCTRFELKVVVFITTYKRII